MLEEVFEAAVSILGRPEAGELPHGPEPAPIHGGIDATRVGKLSRMAQILLKRPVLQIVARIDAIDVESREGGEVRFAVLHRSVPPARG